jgi:chromosome segregation ATPase
MLFVAAPVMQLEAELSAQREEEQRLKEQLTSTVKERELLSWAIEDSRVAAQAEAEARAKVERELEQQVRMSDSRSLSTSSPRRVTHTILLSQYCFFPLFFCQRDSERRIRSELEAVANERQRLMQAVQQKSEDITRETESRLALERELEQQRKLEMDVRQQLAAAAEEKERLFKMVRLTPCVRVMIALGACTPLLGPVCDPIRLYLCRAFGCSCLLRTLASAGGRVFGCRRSPKRPLRWKRRPVRRSRHNWKSSD